MWNLFFDLRNPQIKSSRCIWDFDGSVNCTFSREKTDRVYRFRAKRVQPIKYCNQLKLFSGFTDKLGKISG